MNAKFYIDETAKIKAKLRFLQGCIRLDENDYIDHEFPDTLYIGPYSLIGEGVRLGNGVIIDAYCNIDSNVTIGNNTLVTYRASIGSDSIIGEDCVIGGFVPENCHIGNRCRIFGNLVHSHSDTTMSWDHHEIPEESVRIHDDSFVGFSAIVAGGFDIGPKAYVCAGAIVTRSVPPLHIASGNNKIVHYSKWKGNLKNNPIFK